MTRPLSDAALAHLRQLEAVPDLGTDRYRLLEPLGSGGMGAVWLAEDRQLERPVAIKIAHASRRPGDLAARLVREAHILAQLEHPGIVPIHARGDMPDGRVYYVMKRVRGTRLDAVAGGGRPLASKLDLFRRVCETVAFAHAAGVVHRDLKPENIMVGEFGEVLVLDWGVAKRIGDDTESSIDAEAAADAPPEVTQPTVVRTERGAILGTPAYMAPEQRRGDAEIGPRADVYALGGVLHFLIAGRAPGVEAGSDPTTRTAARHVPRPLAAIVERARAAETAARYADAVALADDVARFQAGEKVQAYQEGVAARALRLAGRYRIPILVVLGYLAVRALLLLLGGR